MLLIFLSVIFFLCHTNSWSDIHLDALLSRLLLLFFNNTLRKLLTIRTLISEWINMRRTAAALSGPVGVDGMGELEKDGGGAREEPAR